MDVRLEFTTDAAEFLAAAGEHLAADPILTSVVTVNAHRPRTEVTQPYWWLVVRDRDGAVAGVGMRTARVAPHPLYLLPMPTAAAVALARALHDRGELAFAVNGALPAAEACAAELARLHGGRVETVVRTRLHELHDLVPPPAVPGRLRTATEDDAELVAAWIAAFGGDADDQAGRPRGTGPTHDPANLLLRLADGQFWLWLDETGQPVSLIGATPPQYGVARIAPVYTPPEHRRRGWAGNAVAEVSRRLQAAGLRVCLFADQANPTSNRIYTALGYRPVVDMANHLVLPPVPR